jgi:hypothetical protein
MFALYKPTNSGHKGEIILTVTGHSKSTVAHIINAPLEKVDITDWLFNIPDAEYQRCSHVHIAAGHTIAMTYH